MDNEYDFEALRTVLINVKVRSDRPLTRFEVDQVIRDVIGDGGVSNLFGVSEPGAVVLTRIVDTHVSKEPKK